MLRRISRISCWCFWRWTMSDPQPQNKTKDKTKKCSCFQVGCVCVDSWFVFGRPSRFLYIFKQPQRELSPSNDSLLSSLICSYVSWWLQLSRISCWCFWRWTMSNPQPQNKTKDKTKKGFCFEVGCVCVYSFVCVWWSIQVPLYIQTTTAGTITIKGQPAIQSDLFLCVLVASVVMLLRGSGGGCLLLWFPS